MRCRHAFSDPCTSPVAATISLQVTSAPHSMAMERKAASVTSTIGDSTSGRRLPRMPSWDTTCPRPLGLKVSGSGLGIDRGPAGDVPRLQQPCSTVHLDASLVRVSDQLEPGRLVLW